MSRTKAAEDQRVDWNKLGGIRSALLRCIRGYKGPRKTPLTQKQIVAFFRATDPQVILMQLDAAVIAGHIRLGKTGFSKRAGYVYDISEAGEAFLASMPVAPSHGELSAEDQETYLFAHRYERLPGGGVRVSCTMPIHVTVDGVRYSAHERQDFDLYPSKEAET